MTGGFFTISVHNMCLQTRNLPDRKAKRPSVCLLFVPVHNDYPTLHSEPFSHAFVTPAMGFRGLSDLQGRRGYDRVLRQPHPYRPEEVDRGGPSISLVSHMETSIGDFPLSSFWYESVYGVSGPPFLRLNTIPIVVFSLYWGLDLEYDHADLLSGLSQHEVK